MAALSGKKYFVHPHGERSDAHDGAGTTTVARVVGSSSCAQRDTFGGVDTDHTVRACTHGDLSLHQLVGYEHPRRFDGSSHCARSNEAGQNGDRETPMCASCKTCTAL